eukprot:3419065-Prymnesium_polylepis.1
MLRHVPRHVLRHVPGSVPRHAGRASRVRASRRQSSRAPDPSARAPWPSPCASRRRSAWATWRGRTRPSRPILCAGESLRSEHDH